MAKFEYQLKEAMPHLWRYAFSLTRERHSSDDLVQDSIERALRKRHLWKPAQPLRPWLMKIQLNVFRDKYRARVRLNEVPFVAEHAGSVSDAAWQDRSELNSVLSRMRELPETQLQALQLVAFAGLSYAEAAEVLDVPLGTIMSRIARARARLNDEPTPVAHGIRSVT